MKADWAQYGPDSFVLEILEEIKMENEESPRAFRDRLKAGGAVEGEVPCGIAVLMADGERVSPWPVEISCD